LLIRMCTLGNLGDITPRELTSGHTLTGCMAVLVSEHRRLQSASWRPSRPPAGARDDETRPSACWRTRARSRRGHCCGKRVGRPWRVQIPRTIYAAVDETARRAADPTWAGRTVLAAPIATALHRERGGISPQPPGLSLGVGDTPKRTHPGGAH